MIEKFQIPVPHRPIQFHFDRAAAEYDLHAKLQRQAARELFSLCHPRFNEGTVLDVGCGTGYVHELIRRGGYRFPVYQLDLAYGMCALAESYAAADTYTVNADAEKLPFADASMNGILSSFTLQWLSEPEQFFTEAMRVLAPGGWLGFCTLGASTLHELREAFAAVDSLEHVRTFEDSELTTRKLTASGFTLSTITTTPLVRYYPTATALMQEMKALGASYTSAQRRRFLGKRGIAQLEQVYQQRHGTEKGLPATWEVVYIVALKH